MKNLLLILTIALTLTSSCVQPQEAVGFAKRAFPECKNFTVISHMLSSHSQTEVSMVCKDDVRKSVTIKCLFGYGIFSNTTCHENN